MRLQRVYGMQILAGLYSWQTHRHAHTNKITFLLTTLPLLRLVKRPVIVENHSISICLNVRHTQDHMHLFAHKVTPPTSLSSSSSLYTDERQEEEFAVRCVESLILLTLLTHSNIPLLRKVSAWSMNTIFIRE